MLNNCEEDLTIQSIRITRFVKKQRYALNHKHCSLHDKGIFINFGNVFHITKFVVSSSYES